MDPVFWHERWQRQDIGFHQSRAHDQLQSNWSRLRLPAQSSVFVPLAGKSLDMTWLAQQGHKIVGVELSEIAIRQFFDEAQLAPSIQHIGAHTVSTAGPYTLWCGDIFELPSSALASVSAAYDRAALIALPPETRARYARKLVELLPPSAPIFLIAIDYPPGEIQGPPFAVPPEDVHHLFGSTFDISVLDQRDGLAASDNLKKRGVTRLDETAYLLARRP